ncbi:MAG: M23 family metallopeptidase [Myxococcales bacterium]|jgi:murein DD-endopeptidase MepM/ murein hydrolase activator NlpD|nr:M23 family metallopeptidase [Myxococcales bacterium]MBK7193191.1 M23 family metallopeptidase [Myxococcales bacterium]
MADPSLAPLGAAEAEAPERTAAKGLESFFLRQLLAEARAGSPGLLDGGFAGDTFRSMLDDALADAMSGAGLGLADTFETALGGTPDADPDAVVLDADEFDRAMGDAPRRAPTTFVAPAIGRYSSDFGERVHPVTHAESFHEGLDIAAPVGAPARAAAAGTVTKAGPAGTYGNLVVLRHADGSETRYAHLATVEVEPGQRLEAGEPLGTVGATGRVTGPHLHFEVRVDGHAVDPAPLLPAPGARY